MIFFSIILPTFNRAHLISETVKTVLQQSYTNFELIIIDDGSTDGTKEVVNESFSMDERIKYFYKINGERGAARNFGLKQAKGDYAVFFDSDDIMKPDYLGSLNAIIENHENVFLLATRYDYFNNGKIENNPAFASLKEGWYATNDFLRGNFLACNFCIKIKNSSYTFFPEERELTTMEDWLFLLTNLQGNKIFIGFDYCVSMRQHDERSMMDNKKVIAARKNATEWIVANLSLSESEKKELKAWSHYFCGIHQYLDLNRKDAMSESIKAIRQGGVKFDFLFLICKAIIGRRIISRIK